ncbi:MAG: ABC transporter permease, partial [Bacillota bacterium]
ALFWNAWLPPFLLLPGALVIGCLAGALWAGIPALLKTSLKVDETLVTLMLNYVAILIAVVVWVLLQKTTFGYEIKACGYNRDASQYAGINAKRNIIYSFMISGALAGLGGGLYYLSGTGQYTFIKVLLAAGFNGIPVALLANSHPIGVIVSALFISYIQVGGDALQPRFVRENIDIIIGVIIYVSAFALLLKLWFGKLFIRRSLSAYALQDGEPDPPPAADLQDAQGEDGEEQ